MIQIKGTSTTFQTDHVEFYDSGILFKDIIDPYNNKTSQGNTYFIPYHRIHYIYFNEEKFQVTCGVNENKLRTCSRRRFVADGFTNLPQ